MYCSLTGRFGASVVVRVCNEDAYKCYESKSYETELQFQVVYIRHILNLMIHMSALDYPYFYDFSFKTP